MEFITGVAVGIVAGAALAPFWMNMWEKAKNFIKSNTPPKE